MTSNTGNRLAIHQLLNLESVQLKLNGTQREDVLRELVDTIPVLKKETAARNTLFAALLEREKLHSTGIGDGVALPHARNALVGMVENPVIVFGRHATGVHFGAIDGEVSKIFLLVVAPNVTQHLGILARLSRILRDGKVRQALLLAEKPEKVINILKQAEIDL
jgi:mannitol/fructose-specific phosphotransferase system IIA component (Ntr-type)